MDVGEVTGGGWDISGGEAAMGRSRCDGGKMAGEGGRGGSCEMSGGEAAAGRSRRDRGKVAGRGGSVGGTAGHTSLRESCGNMWHESLGRTLEDGGTWSTGGDWGRGKAMLEGSGGGGRALVCGLWRCRWRRIIKW